MTDTKTIEQRSINMSAIRSKDTVPEVFLRKLLFAYGFRYRKIKVPRIRRHIGASLFGGAYRCGSQTPHIGARFCATGIWSWSYTPHDLNVSLGKHFSLVFTWIITILANVI